MAVQIPCFKAYDIRGKVPEELNAELAQKIGRAFAAVCGVKKIVIGRDIRHSGEELTAALTEGLCEMGVQVLDFGLCGTEEIYHGAFSLVEEGIDGGIIVTASHNPKGYNGMKFVTSNARPLSSDALQAIKTMVLNNSFPKQAGHAGRRQSFNNKQAYINHLLGYIKTELKPLKIVANSGNGCAGPVLDALSASLPFKFIRLNHEPDGSFPKGVPNPLLPQKREETSFAVREHGADFGIAWDGDFDRCFFWDEKGTFIEGYYLVGLFASEMLQKEPGAAILYDPRLIWNSEELIAAYGGRPVLSRTGHAFIKEKMRAEDAIYGGEMSAHHYFRDFGYCDSGMIPWLLLASLLCRTGKKLSELVAERMAAFPVSGEINSTVKDPDKVIAEIAERYKKGEQSYIDGLSVTFPDYRFNIRKSNTEPLLRLNVETRGDKVLLSEKTNELLAIVSKGNK